MSKEESIQETLRRAAAQLRTATDRPRLEAEILLAHLLGRARVFLHAHPEMPLTARQIATYSAWIHRRAAHEPLPYLTGEIEFYGRDFTITPEVLIPRPETELLVETALAWTATHEARRVVDVGTGSGCIAVTLATELRGLQVVATDLSAAALRVARVNARRHDVAARVSCVQADLLTPLSGPFDLIVSNPPYVTEGEWATLPPSVRQEPRQALLAGPQGLDVIRRLLFQARSRLQPDGLLLVEIGERQGAAVRALAQATFPQAEVCLLQDLAGRDRLLRLKV
ncbi:MAG: peptide chain release factor N(5)-glutamine methyltransferase [Anaerolineae bacterium]